MQKDGTTSGTISCETRHGIRWFKFPAGTFDIDRQVVVPAKTAIEGNANPNDPSDKTKEPDPATQTYFVATRGVTDPAAAYCGTGGNMKPGDAQKLRIGFLLNSHTVVKNINFQGRDTTRPYDNGSLCGGGAFETPGCVSPGFADGRGTGWLLKRKGCYDHFGTPNSLVTGDGKGVQNILIDSVRLNSLLVPSDPTQYKRGQGTQLAVWVAMTQDGSATKNVKVKNLVSMLTRGDGINFHGNVHNSLVVDCHIENTGDDIYAVWGAYAENPSGIVFANNVGKNPGVTRSYIYGVCVAVYGAKDVTFTGTKCYDTRTWNPHCRPCNSCLAFVHDNFFGAVYPRNNAITIYGNQYLYMDGSRIPHSDRPSIRVDSGSAARILAYPRANDASALELEANLDGALVYSPAVSRSTPRWAIAHAIGAMIIGCGVLCVSIRMSCKDTSNSEERHAADTEARHLILRRKAIKSDGEDSGEESAVE